jgi:KUP system potassium uptake protein
MKSMAEIARDRDLHLAIAGTKPSLASSAHDPGEPTTQAYPINGNAAIPIRNRTIQLAVAALGVVYGDIGTSPLYAVRECFNGPHAVALNETNFFGVVSLIFWSLTIVVTVKYVGFILRADNRGEGGIFALLGLIMGSNVKLAPRMRAAVFLGAIFGAALLYGDGVITPSISVLSAVEGLEVATQTAKPFIVPLTCAVLVALFLLQKRGTSGIGRIFGPVMIIWFLTIGTAGLIEILQFPRILAGLDPRYGWRFFANNHLHGFEKLRCQISISD